MWVVKYPRYVARVEPTHRTVRMNTNCCYSERGNGIEAYLSDTVLC